MAFRRDVRYHVVRCFVDDSAEAPIGEELEPTSTVANSLSSKPKHHLL